jgi:hypothetical protein
MPDSDIDDRDLDDRILDAPVKDPIVVPPVDPKDIDPVPEPLRPTPSRLTLWTALVIALFFIIAASFTLLQLLQTPSPTAVTNPPVAGMLLR